MHPTTSELLGRRDGDGSLAVRDGLRALPELEPPPGSWDRILAEHRRRRRARVAWQAAAGAAVLAIATLVPVVGVRSPSAPASPPQAGSGADVGELVAASRELERVLRAPALQSPVLRPEEAARIVELEDRIAVIDVELGAVGPRPTSGRAVVLWSDRVELLDELVRARAGVEGSGDVVVAVKQTNGREP
jgi:hypothetical protein